MNRRAFLAALAAAACPLLASSPRTAEAAGDRNATESPSSAALGLAAQVRFARRLLGALGDGAGSNLVVSPMSAAAALALVATAGDKAFLKGVADVLALPGALDRDGFAMLVRHFAPLEGEGGPLVSANALVLDRAIEPEAGFLEKLRGLGVEVSLDDLSKPEAVASINAWVSSKTRGLIPAILDEPPGAGALAALNALHFKDRWKTPFDPTNTLERPMLGLDGIERSTPMMIADGDFRHRIDRKRGLIAVDLPFADTRFALSLVGSTKAPMSSRALLKAGGGWLDGGGFRTGRAELLLPKLSIGATRDLLGPLSRIGLERGLGPSALSGFRPKAPRITAVLQRIRLELDETGAEAAAATAVIATRSAFDEVAKLRFDRPFLFALRDDTRGALVLAGYVAKPMGES